MLRSPFPYPTSALSPSSLQSFFPFFTLLVVGILLQSPCLAKSILPVCHFPIPSPVVSWSFAHHVLLATSSFWRRESMLRVAPGARISNPRNQAELEYQDRIKKQCNLCFRCAPRAFMPRNICHACGRQPHNFCDLAPRKNSLRAAYTPPAHCHHGGSLPEKQEGLAGAQILMSRFIDFGGPWAQDQGEPLLRIKISHPIKRDHRRISFDSSFCKTLGNTQLFFCFLNPS